MYIDSLCYYVFQRYFTNLQTRTLTWQSETDGFAQEVVFNRYTIILKSFLTTRSVHFDAIGLGM